MRKLLVAAWLVFAGSAWASGIEFWTLFGETQISNGGLGTESCAAGTTTAACQSIGATGSDVALSSGFGSASAGDGFHFGFRGGFNSGDHLGYEMGYTYNRTTLQAYGVNAGGMAYHQVMFNALYYITGPDAKFRPFVTGGLGFVNYAPPGTSAAYGGGSSKLGVNYGAGVKYKLTDRYGIRVDIGQVTTPKPLGLPLASGWLRETEVSLGFGIFF